MLKRFAESYPALAFYWSVLRGIPAAVSSAIQSSGNVTSLVGILVVVGGFAAAWALLSPWVAAGLFLVLLVLVLLRSNYERFEAIERERDEWHAQYRHIWAEDINKTTSRAADSVLNDQLSKGITLLAEGVGDEWRDYVGRVDSWGKETQRLLGDLGSQEEVVEYTEGLPWLTADVSKDQLRVFLEIRLTRLHAIVVRPRKQAVTEFTIEPELRGHKGQE